MGLVLFTHICNPRGRKVSLLYLFRRAALSSRQKRSAPRAKPLCAVVSGDQFFGK
jgi:hypothetical protein